VSDRSLHVLLTGATGFLGQGVLERLLSGRPDSRISVLVRPRRSQSAQFRIERLLRKPVFAGWVDEVGDAGVADALAHRITVLEGDLGAVPPLPPDLDVVIHSASSVSFDLAIDEAFEVNVGGPVSLYEAIAASGSDPHVVHVSTCYVNGLVKGLVEERRLAHDVDRESEAVHARAARQHAESVSRQTETLDPLLRTARREHRRAGAAAVAEATESARAAWVESQLVDAGRMRAQSLGWPDVYTFTKALGERVAEDHWGQRRLTVVRPSIIESAWKHPYPGWIDGYKVADPLFAAYGRGLLPEFPILADTVVDLIPVDHVVDAIVAAASAPPERGEARYLQVCSGARNPLRFGELIRLVGDYFDRHPVIDEHGAPVSTHQWSFPTAPSVDHAVRRREIAVRAAGAVAGRLPATTTTRGWVGRLDKARADLATLRQFIDLYQPYAQTMVVFDDAHTLTLHEEAAKRAAVEGDDRDRDGFDIAEVGWPHYLQEVHLPHIPGIGRTVAKTGGRGDSAASALPRRDDVLAVFDLHGTVSAASLIEQYFWVGLAGHGTAATLVDGVRVLGDVPTYLAAERRDRGDFIRTFMRRYAGMHEEDLRQAIARSPALRGRLHEEAVARIKQHREAGHRTVLVTGQIGVFVEPLADLFDVIVAGEMETDASGRWTGHLERSPLVEEARAAWLRHYARDEGMDLSASYAYGDTYADRPWLDVVGHPAVVNPDIRLLRFARGRRWPVLEWTTTAQGRVGAFSRSVRAGGAR
jgi:alcohol-forming fatty acyl-CoA reductase